MSRRDDSKHRGREGYESHQKEIDEENLVRDRRKRCDDTETKRSRGISAREDVSKVTTTSEEKGSSSSKKIQQVRKEEDISATELVNRNIAGAGPTGYMTADQKRKLLWGNKKNTTAEEGVKSEVKLEQKPENQEGADILRAEKQKELQQELEKQYTAGLRRRDGRTVGLGL